MKLNLKQSSLLIFASAVVCLVMPYILDYWFGYYGWDISDITVTLFLVGLILPLVQVGIWIISLVRKNHSLWTTAILIALFALKVIGNIMPRPEILIMHGMRNRIVKDYGLNDLRNFARDFDRLPNLPDYRAPDKDYSYDDLVKTGLEKKYPFLMLLRSLHHSGPDDVDEQNGILYVSGSRLQGGIDFEVGINGMKIIPQSSDEPILRVSDDVFFSERD